MLKMKYLNVEYRNNIAIITIDRPPVNAWNLELQNEFDITLNQLDERDDIIAAIITGKGNKAFIAGADLKYIINMTPEEGAIFSNSTQTVLNKIRSLRQIIIAAINGMALGGGCEVAMACDIRIADEKATIGLPEVGLGLMPGAGGTQRLPRLIGSGKAIELMTTGNPIKAIEAHRIGLIEKIVKENTVLIEAIKLAEKIGSRGPIAVANVKRAIYQGLESNIEDGMKIENRLFSSLFDTQDFVVGTKAFLEKKSPKFSGK